LGFKQLDPSEILGGNSVKESADIFMTVLSGNATEAQNNVVLCNAALAIKTITPGKSFSDSFYEAEEALVSKKALKSFKTLVEN